MEKKMKNKRECKMQVGKRAAEIANDIPETRLGAVREEAQLGDAVVGCAQKLSWILQSVETRPSPASSLTGQGVVSTKN